MIVNCGRVEPGVGRRQLRVLKIAQVVLLLMVAPVLCHASTWVAYGVNLYARDRPRR